MPNETDLVLEQCKRVSDIRRKFSDNVTVSFDEHMILTVKDTKFFLILLKFQIVLKEQLFD